MISVSKFSLRSNRQQTLGTLILLATPILCFPPIYFLVAGILGLQASILPVDPSVGIGLYCFFAIALCIACSRFISIIDGVLSYGLLGINKINLSRLKEVSGDEGDESNDFQESLILEIDDGRILRIELNDYDEVSIRAFLACLKEASPQCKYTYSDVISLESRGLLQFLVSSAQPDNLIVKLSKTPIEDMIMQLIKSHESAFCILYSVLSLVGLVALSCSLLVSHPELNQLFSGNQFLQQSGQLGHFHASLQIPANTDSLEWRFAVIAQAIFDYLSHDGVNIRRVMWITIGFLAFCIPVVRLVSPTFVFVDAISIGTAMRFLKWENVKSVTLRKLSEMADPLEGVLLIEDDAKFVIKVDLTRVPDLKKRQLLLQLVDRYAADAQRNEDFMRATNSLVEIQFTDLWLEELDSQAALGEASVPLVGSSLAGGSYEVESLLSYGGQATTYLARSRGEESNMVPVGHFVVKELVLPNQADVRILQDAINRFERGAVLLKRLEHPQIVKLWDHFVENGKAYLILEYIEGKTLRQLIKETGPISPEEVCRLGMQICSILNYLHSREPPVIHCDLAPDNLILSPSGKIKLVDFDVARVLDARAHSVIAGRPSFTPPEQFRGNPTTQSDIFALGAILHFLSTGADPPPLAAGVIEDPMQNDLSDLEKLIRDCLAFEASDRPAAASEVGARLESVPAAEIDPPTAVSFTIKIPNLENETAP